MKTALQQTDNNTNSEVNT